MSDEGEDRAGRQNPSDPKRGEERLEDEPLVVVRSADGQRVSLLFADVIQNNSKSAAAAI